MQCLERERQAKGRQYYPSPAEGLATGGSTNNTKPMVRYGGKGQERRKFCVQTGPPVTLSLNVTDIINRLHLSCSEMLILKCLF